MSVIKVFRDLDGLFNYSADENPTSQQDYQEAVKNWVKTIVSLVDSNLWQPETEYTVGSQLLTPSLPYYVLRCTVAGTSGAAEPDYTDVALGDEITDGTVTWVVDGYLPLSGGTMTGSIQYVDNGKVFAIAHTEAGNVDLGWSWENGDGAGLALRSSDVPSPGEFMLFARDANNDCSLKGTPDGFLTWNNEEIFHAGKTIPIANGGTGASDANGACNNLGLSWDYWHRYGMNFVPNDTSNPGWNNLGVFSSYYTETGKIKNQPTQYGQLLNIPANNKNAESTQIWIEQPNGNIYVRGGNLSTPINDAVFRKVAFQDDVNGIVAANLAQNGYVKFSNGLLVQWGFGASPYGTAKTYTYPLSYSINAFNVVIGSAGGNESTCRINSVSKDSFIAQRHYCGSGKGSGNLYWLAIGV